MDTSSSYGSSKGLKDFLDRLRGAAQSKKDDASEKMVPNRKILRSKGINVTRSTGKGHARVSGAKKAPASFFNLIAVHQTMPNGTVKKVVIPRDRFIDNREA